MPASTIQSASCARTRSNSAFARAALAGSASFETSKDVLSHREWKLFHANGRPCDPNEWPMNRAIFYGEIVTCEVFKIRRADRSYGYVVANAAPLRDHRGQIIAGMLTMMEISGLPLGRVGSGRKSFVERPRHAA